MVALDLKVEIESRGARDVSYQIQDGNLRRYAPTDRHSARSNSTRHIKMLSPLRDQSVAPAPWRLSRLSDDTDAG